MRLIFALVACIWLLGSSHAIRPHAAHQRQHLAQQAQSQLAATIQPHQHQQQLQHQQRALLQVGNMANIVGAVAQGVNMGIGLTAPVVNAVASHVPVILPSVTGFCMNGQPIVPFKQRPDMVFCLVGNGAQVTNFMFNTASRLTGAAGSIVNGGLGKH